MQDMHIMYYALVAVLGEASAFRGVCRYRERSPLCVGSYPCT
jgi:hypothetical protein